VIDFSLLWKLIVPFVLIMIGLKMIFGGLLNKKADKVYQKLKEDGKSPQNGTAVFSSNRMDFDGQEFYGAELNSIFGGLICDLNGAHIHEDCVINACAVFGGIDVMIPDGLNVKIHSTSIFGGVSDKKKRPAQENAPTVYINATCMFGGMDLK
jgi:predicted membrane protein